MYAATIESNSLTCVKHWNVSVTVSVKMFSESTNEMYDSFISADTENEQSKQNSFHSVISVDEISANAISKEWFIVYLLFVFFSFLHLNWIDFFSASIRYYLIRNYDKIIDCFQTILSNG